MDDTIWRGPVSGNPLRFDRAAQALIDEKTGEAFPIDRDGIVEFIKTEDIQGSNAKSTSFYNGFSPFYELGQKLWYSLRGGEKRARNDYLRYLTAKSGDRVLEVSVGTAANIKYLTRDAEYYGLDISIGQLRQSIRNREKYRLPL